MRRQPQPPPPAYWMALCTAFLRTSDQLALELWETFTRHYCWRVSTVRYCLDKLGTTAATVEVWQQRTEHFEEVLPARDLLALGQKLSPEGRRRRADVVQFEERLLRYMTSEGQWR